MSTSVLPPVKRYHSVQVILHWAIAILIFLAALLAGDQEGEGARRAAAGIAGISTLGIHMIIGITVLVLLIVRLLMRWLIKSPEWATTGSAFLDKVGRWTHVALYVFAFAVTITGLILALQTNRLARVFGGNAFNPNQFRSGQFQQGQLPPPGGFRAGGERPGGFEGGFARGRFFLGAFHGVSWTLLLLLIILHVGAALYHQFFRKDNLFGRMWFGKST